MVCGCSGGKGGGAVGDGGGVGVDLLGGGCGGKKGCLAGGKVAKHDEVRGAGYAALVCGVDGVLELGDEDGPVGWGQGGHGVGEQLLQDAV